VVEGDLSPHGMPDKHDIALSQIVAKRFQVGVEGSDLQFFWIIGVSMPTKIECNHMMMVGQRGCEVVPPMGIGTASMEEDDDGASWVSPLKGV
jgi:hypothetical protein